MTAAPERPRWAQGDHDDIVKAPTTHINDELNLHNLSSALMAREVITNGLRFMRTTSWATETPASRVAEQAATVSYYAQHVGQSELLLQDDGWAVRLGVGDGRAVAALAASSAAKLDGVLAELRELLPPVEIDKDEPRVPVMFWSLSPTGPVGRSRMLDVPPWDDIAGHYVEATGRNLAALMEDFTPGVGGQLLLWHGLPGTGKTYALRALLWEWRRWCDIHYVTDPEEFFGNHANYMLDVLLHDELGGALEPPVEGREEPEAPDERASAGRWKLLVLEDTGELMSADARTRSGQGLSRLLNVVDGLIGQGLRVLVLVTTNEELRTLHPAVARSGRCASKVLFHPLPADESREWLAERGVEDADFEGAQTIADLYAMLEHRETSAEREPARPGFAR